MKNTSKVIMGATLVMVVSLAIVLCLLLVLLAELYCSLLLRRRCQLRHAATNSTTTIAHVPHPQEVTVESLSSSTSPLGSFYAQGVLNAPRNILFPLVSRDTETKTHLSKLHDVLEIRDEQIASFRRIGILSPPPLSLHLNHDIQIQSSNDDNNDDDDVGKDHLVYISNPIYDNGMDRVDTPFETPDTSPSRLESVGSSGDDDADIIQLQYPSYPITPPLSPMKNLVPQVEGCSVHLTDARRCLGTSGSDSSNKKRNSWSSSGDSPCTTPSM